MLLARIPFSGLPKSSKLSFTHLGASSIRHHFVKLCKVSRTESVAVSFVATLDVTTPRDCMLQVMNSLILQLLRSLPIFRLALPSKSSRFAMTQAISLSIKLQRVMMSLWAERAVP